MPPGQNEGQIKKRFGAALDMRGYTGDRSDQDAVYQFWFGAESIEAKGGQWGSGVTMDHWVKHRESVATVTIDWREHISDEQEGIADIQIHGDGSVTDTDTGDPVIVITPT